jgi:hypothetical protein
MGVHRRTVRQALDPVKPVIDAMQREDAQHLCAFRLRTLNTADTEPSPA